MIWNTDFIQYYKFTKPVSNKLQILSRLTTPLKDPHHFFYVILYYFYYDFLLCHITHSTVTVTTIYGSLRCLLRVHSFRIWTLSVGYDDDTSSNTTGKGQSLDTTLSQFEPPPSSQIMPSEIHRLAITPPLSWPSMWRNILWKCLLILRSKIWITPPASRNINLLAPDFFFKF